MEIVPFHPDFAPAFSALNRAWIERLFAIEASDVKVLDHPREAILDRGGEIYFAVDEGVVVGTVALVPTESGAVEMAKMAVAPSHQGQGIGETLGRQAIAWAKEHQVEHFFLLTSRKLDGAIRLYERLGFVHGALPEHTGYRRAEVYMEYPREAFVRD